MVQFMYFNFSTTTRGKKRADIPWIIATMMPEQQQQQSFPSSCLFAVRFHTTSRVNCCWTQRIICIRFPWNAPIAHRVSAEPMIYYSITACTRWVDSHCAGPLTLECFYVTLHSLQKIMGKWTKMNNRICCS